MLLICFWLPWRSDVGVVPRYGKFAWITVMTDVRAEDGQFQRSRCSAVAVIGLVSQQQP